MEKKISPTGDSLSTGKDYMSYLLAQLAVSDKVVHEKFTPFPRLPVELKIQIFKEALPGRRVFPVEPYTRSGQATIQFKTLVAPPGMLRACQLSRKVVLEAHDVVLSTRGSKKTIRFSGKKDVLLLHSSDPSSALPALTWLPEHSGWFLSPQSFNNMNLAESAYIDSVKQVIIGMKWSKMCIVDQLAWGNLIRQFDNLERIDLLASSVGLESASKIDYDKLEEYYLRFAEKSSKSLSM